jgi:hypothetical protein
MCRIMGRADGAKTKGGETNCRDTTWGIRMLVVELAYQGWRIDIPFVLPRILFVIIALPCYEELQLPSSQMTIKDTLVRGTPL